MAAAAVPLFDDMGVGAQGQRRIRVPETPGHGAHVDPGSDELGGGEMSEVVQADVFEPEAVTGPHEEPGDVVGPEGLRTVELG
jgi:hypothetical protein